MVKVYVEMRVNDSAGQKQDSSIEPCLSEAICSATHMNCDCVYMMTHTDKISILQMNEVRS